MDEAGVTVRCCCEGLEATATYEVAGPHLIVRSTLGVFRTIAGVRNPRRTAQRLLRNVCTNMAKGRAAPAAE